jgi:hypothetical protein
VMAAQQMTKDKGDFLIKVFHHRKQIINFYILMWLGSAWAIVDAWLFGKLSDRLMFIVLVDGPLVLLLPVLAWRFLHFTKTIGQQLNGVQAIPSSTRSWFQFLTYCIPKSISEPWLGDMREMREAMRAEGYSKRAVLWATVSQFALLLLHWGLSKGVDILTPFKKSKIE